MKADILINYKKFKSTWIVVFLQNSFNVNQAFLEVLVSRLIDRVLPTMQSIKLVVKKIERFLIAVLDCV